MKKAITVLFSTLLFLGACVEDDNIRVRMLPVEQTLFIYMPWSTDLTDYFYRNVADFEYAMAEGIPSGIRIMVFLADQANQATLFELRYENGRNIRKVHKNYTDPAFTTAGWITSVLKDMKTAAPAKRYAMIIGAHGMGWLPVPGQGRAAAMKYHWDTPAEPLTRFFGGKTREYQTEISTLAKGISDAGMKMEYILFDDCYMSCVEVAYQLKEVTDYLIGCPTEIMAYGFPYHTVGRYLVGEVDYRAVCDGFYDFYSTYEMPYGTIGVTDCSEIDRLAAIMKEINDRFAFDAGKIGSVQRLDRYDPTIFFDLGDYAAKLCGDAELLERFTDQLALTVPYSSHTQSYPGGGIIKTYSGITVSDPSLHELAVSKTETPWYKATH